MSVCWRVCGGGGTSILPHACAMSEWKNTCFEFTLNRVDLARHGSHSELRGHFEHIGHFEIHCYLS